LALDKFIDCCKDWKVMGSDLSIVRQGLTLAHITSSPEHILWDTLG
jgi:hypothetical protein